MRREDVPQVNEIDHEAFPGWWPTTNYEHELDNKLAHFIVAYEKTDGNPGAPKPAAPVPEEKGINRLASRLRGFLNPNHSEVTSPQDRVLGFAGFWVMADEAHVMSVATRGACRREGIGELMLLALIDMATAMKACVVTLEVRVSNYVAQDLYKKLGFREVGIRRGYYSDNREDAYVMTTDDIQTVPFQSHLKKLKKLYIQRWGNRFCEDLKG